MSCKTCTTVAALISILLQDAANDGCNSCASLARLVLSFIAAAKSSSSVAAIILSFIKVYRKFHCMFYCSCDPSISTDNLQDCSCVLYYIRPTCSVQIAYLSRSQLFCPVAPMPFAKPLIVPWPQISHVFR